MQQQRKNESGIWHLCLPSGIALGTGFGALFGNIGVGMSFGVALGTTLSLLLYDRGKRKTR